MSTSGLAKRAGLDATAFNKSKRMARDGRPRWPSTESLALALAAVESNLIEFAALIAGQSSGVLPSLRLDEADRAHIIDSDGVLSATSDTDIRWVDETLHADTFILEVSTDALAPAYKAGERVIVSPQAEIKIGDRALLKLLTGQLVIAKRQPAAGLIAEPAWQRLSGDLGLVSNAKIVWAFRILWLSQ
ncbi:MAG: helix-turn-helix transcriptional regulator [Pseudomonadota bacterium]